MRLLFAITIIAVVGAASAPATAKAKLACPLVRASIATSIKMTGSQAAAERAAAEAGYTPAEIAEAIQRCMGKQK